MTIDCNLLGRNHTRPDKCRTFIRTNEYYFLEIGQATNPTTQEPEMLYEISNPERYYDCYCTICGNLINSEPTGRFIVNHNSPMFHSKAVKLKYGL